MGTSGSTTSAPVSPAHPRVLAHVTTLVRLKRELQAGDEGARARARAYVREHIAPGELDGTVHVILLLSGGCLRRASRPAAPPETCGGPAQ